MAESIPYLSTPGSLRIALDKIADAATPERVTGDFVRTVLGLKGGTAGAMIPYLKRIGMVASDGSPSELYKRYRNKTTAGLAIADALKTGYKKLSDVNEYFYKLNDADLKALLVQVTGSAQDSSVVSQAFSTLKILKGLADFDAKASGSTTALAQPPVKPLGEKGTVPETRALGLNLSYTINLNLPATSDQAVFNAIFRSLKEFLITDAPE
jgi:hypothetical protein